MDAEAKRIKQQNKELPFKKRMSNWWNYYKAHFFVALACLIIFGTGIVQCTMQTKYDMHVSIYCAEYVSDERVAEITEILNEQCKDITGDEKVNVSVSSYVADVSDGNMDQMVYATLPKLTAEIASNSSAAFIVDEVFKTYLVESYEYPEEDFIEISGVLEVRERLKLATDEKLYWLPMPRSNEVEAPDQFDNAELVKKYLENK